ncbi:MAG TPA: type II toxin-antitoxin system YafQ family toxin [Candidatus Kapabacteria bacterium]|nr:type II toxin-antitoxin system YafQ family toxin [Candidatus Kapabacteria bacterium]
MLTIVRSNQFERDVKRLSRSGSRDISKLKEVIKKLVNEERLDMQYKNHPLVNNWKGCLECHISPDWLLIYRLNKEKKELELVRTGSHSELF